MNIDETKKQLEEMKLKVQREIANVDRSVQSIPDSEIAEEFEGADIMNGKIDNFRIKDSLIEELGDIDIALSKIKKNKYGICENCKNPIEDKRLGMYPFARYCMKCMIQFDND